MVDESDVCVLVPTLNEAATIGDVIEGFHEHGFERVLVIDGGSSDDTRPIAREHGADLRRQTASGKGRAILEAMDHIDAEYVIMVDGDGTYRPADASRLLAALADGADHVIGNRFHAMEDGAMSRLNRYGNLQINRLYRFINQRDLHDILSGYRGFTTESFRELDLSATGFGIEAEMTSEAARLGHRIEEVPITYGRRPAASETKLRPFRDGAIILGTLYRIARMNNPLFFFGSVGVLGILFGIILGLYVGYRWYFVGVSHEIIAVVSSFFIIFGFLLVMFGVLSDLIVTLHQEHRQRIDQLQRELERRG